MSILIRDGFLVTMNEARETFARGYVVVDDDGRIASAGPIEQVPAGTYAETIDAEGMIVVPGLINSLQRPAQALLRGFTHDEASDTWPDGERPRCFSSDLGAGHDSIGHDLLRRSHRYR